MSPRALFALGAALAALAGCGQRGPLTLPESARPIEPAAGAPATVPPPTPPATTSDPPAAPNADVPPRDGDERRRDESR